MLAVLLACFLAALIAGRASEGDPIDASLGAALVDGVRHGGDLYSVAVDSARSAGVAASALVVPLPTLFVIEGHLPLLIVLAAAMLLAVLVVLAWYARYGEMLATGRARAAALLLMLLGLAVAVRPALAAVPEGWAGMLVALSLARRIRGRATEPVALGLAAVMLSPAALPHALVMALAAWRERTGDEGARREMAGWCMVLLAGLAALALHARALAIVMAPSGGSAGDGVGLGATIAALGWATGLRAFPPVLMLPLVVLAIVGWASRREPVATRVVALVVLQAGLVAALGAPDAALIVAPLLPLGLLAIPVAARGLFAAALDKRRITVTRLGKDGLVR